MIYTDLTGRTVEGSVWSAGPKDKTIWVIGPDGEAVVVNPTKAEQVEYTAPHYLPPVPDSAIEVAQEILDRYRSDMDMLRPILGNTTPVSPDYKVAAEIIKMAEAAEASRKPFIEAHGGRKPISDERLRQIAAKEIQG
ncbi:hypothetical protein [Nocardia sp. NPDC057440]|uniref:hypothetical protein n=1 Tax=Nocardia sp. NPDC057440 TaxID=3346134 RepID=UPI00366EE632